MKLKFNLYEGLQWFSSRKRVATRKTKSSQRLTEYKRKINKTVPDKKFIDIDYEKEVARLMYREGYYDANIKARYLKGTKIMEDIINNDFEIKWGKLKNN